ncbi:hypothetical protein KS4_23600 [Poriferisphaera corsica]|uniref:Uncharacterized protein n=1 Tax=Poriferisphaera corsica TaxID=2528020 RepID=A0A517YVR9_9BACT|nr:hypothetical protein [Poriferisphaera corsica]QDU34293.1 hypothetical protein KS4_23600 [Poriferisphaera corsica]
MSKSENELLADDIAEAKAMAGLDPASGDDQTVIMISMTKERHDALLKHIHELEELVEKLPKTADGVVVAPTNAVYGSVTGRRYIVDDCWYCTRDRNFGKDEDHIDNSEDERVYEGQRVLIGRCYSTREAAKEAIIKRFDAK